MTEPSSPTRTPLDGHARIEAPQGAVTLTWTSFGTATDAFVAGSEAPHQVVLSDVGQVSAVSVTLRQIATELRAQGQEPRFHLDDRSGRPDELSQTLVREGGLTQGVRFVQLRGRVPEALEIATASQGSDLPEVSVHDVATGLGSWLDLYRSSLAERPQRGVTTEAGAQRQIQDLELPRPTFFAAVDPTDANSLVGAITASAIASTPGAPVVGELAMLAVRPDWRRRGLGTKLIATALEHLGEVSSRTALAYVDEGNVEAMALFTKLGFNERGARTYYEFAS